MNSLLVTGGRVLDPANRRDEVADLLILDGKIAAIGNGATAKENIATGTVAAARGGFTSVVCMPNTSPAIDNAGTVALISERAKSQGCVNVFISGAITKGI